MAHTSASSNSTVASAMESPQRNRWGLWLLLITLGIAGGWGLWTATRSEDEPPPAAAAATPVTTEVTQLAPVKVSSEFVGALEAQDRVTLKPEVEGRIRQIFVEDGARVSAGTPILQLDPERSQAIVRGALADIEVARAARNTAQADLLEAEANRDTALAEKVLQDTEYERTQMLVDAGASAQQSLDQVARDRDAAIAALTAAERRIQAAQANLQETNASLQRAESDATVAGDDLSDYQVVAPIDGTVGDFQVKVGDFVTTGELLTTLIRNQTMDLRLSIPVERSASLQLGLPVELRTEAASAPIVVGNISFIAERVEDSAQGILAKATFPNPGERLRDEQFVRARVVWEEQSSVLVPTTAVSRVGGQSFVFVMEPDEAAEGYIAVQQPVQLGVIEGNRYQIISGLQPGETIITAGILRLSDGALVTPE